MKLYALLTTLFLLISFCQARSAEFRSVDNGVCDVTLNGPISRGDVEAIDRLVKSRSYTNSICLNSDGGSFLVGMELLSFFMENGIATHVRAADRCHSACATAFLGGSEWGDFRHNSRSMEIGAIIGFHAPYVVSAKQKYSREEYSQSVSTGVQITRFLLSNKDSLKISMKFFENFLLFNSHETKLVTSIGDAAHGGISISNSVQRLNTDKTSLANACELVFDVNAERLYDAQSALAPYFEKHPSEFSSLIYGETKGINRQVMWTVTSQHTDELPYQTATCAFDLGNVGEQGVSTEI